MTDRIFASNRAVSRRAASHGAGSRWAALLLATCCTAAVACDGTQNQEELGHAKAALETDDAALNHLWDIYRDLENARQQLEQARQSVQPNSLREEIRLRMEEARMQLERGREHIEIARVQRTEQSFVDAAVELDQGASMLEAEGVIMDALPIVQLTEAQAELEILLNVVGDDDAPTRIDLRAIPANVPPGVDYIPGTTGVFRDSSRTEAGCRIHSYATDVFRYNLTSDNPIDCPEDIRLRAITFWSGESEDWYHASDPLPLDRYFQSSNGRYVCAYAQDGWRYDISSIENNACFTHDAPTLVLLMDFADNDMDSYLPDAEQQWGELMFGTEQAQANHYFNQLFPGRFKLQPVRDTQGTVDNGVVHVQIGDDRPTSGKYVIEDQTWLPDALDLASAYVNFDAYDTNGDGELTNDELSVLFVPNLPYSRTDGAGAQANIRLDHAINGTGPVLERFARTNYTYTSIGVNVHELAHHILGLKHFVAPTDHGIMGLGSYAEDPVIENLSSSSHSGTRPTLMVGVNRLLAQSVVPQEVSGTTTVTLHSIQSGDYNLVAIPVQGSTLYVENRPKQGYDESIPFCGSDAGGVFMTEYIYVSGRPLRVEGIEERRDADSYFESDVDFCEHYSVQGHNDSFEYGGYTFTNFSQAGDVMQFDLIDNGVTKVVDNYKFEWWINDPFKGEGWRMRYFERATPGQDVVLDFADMPPGYGDTMAVGISMWAYYNTGEKVATNHEATWTTTSDYVNITQGNNGPLWKLVSFRMDPDETYTSSATVTAQHSSGTYTLRLINLPDVTN